MNFHNKMLFSVYNSIHAFILMRLYKIHNWIATLLTKICLRQMKFAVNNALTATAKGIVPYAVMYVI